MFSTEILEGVSCSPNTFGKIASLAAADQEPETAFVRNQLISQYITKGGAISRKLSLSTFDEKNGLFSSFAPFDPFMEIQFTTISFDFIEQFPPHLISCEIFSKCPYGKFLKRQIDRVHVLPFTKWDEILYSSQTIAFKNNQQELHFFLNVNGRKFVSAFLENSN